jgi:hypothetical protein
MVVTLDLQYTHRPNAGGKRKGNQPVNETAKLHT